MKYFTVFSTEPLDRFPLWPPQGKSFGTPSLEEQRKVTNNVRGDLRPES